MGCPAKRVTGGLAGSALMRDLDPRDRDHPRNGHRGFRSRDIEDAARLGPVLASMPRSWRGALGEEGIALLTVHGRTPLISSIRAKRIGAASAL